MIKHDEYSAITELLDIAKIDAMSSSELAKILGRLGADNRGISRSMFKTVDNGRYKESERIMDFRENIVDITPPKRMNDILKFV